MQRQLTLIDSSPEWALDEHTKEIGLKGIAQARAALAAALAHQADDHAGRSAA